MPRLFYLADSGWWQAPLFGEAGSIYFIGEPERGPDDPPPLRGEHGPPMAPGEAEAVVVDEPPPGYENAGPYIDEEFRDAWYELALAFHRGEIEPLGERPFDRLAYSAAGACTVPREHPPPGTNIGGPNVPGSTHDPNDPPNNWQSDNAVDLWLYPGTVVRAIAAGTVSRTYGYGYSGPPESRFGGSRLHIEHAGGLVSFSQHLERITVARGAHVRRGQAIGRSGFGNCVPHLHLAVNYPHNVLAYAQQAYDASAPPTPPPPPREPPPVPRRAPRRTPDESWSNLMHAIGPNRRRYRRRLAAARRALRGALR